ncbi:MAG: hypothetical protein M3Y20_05800 [Actinomycetota bacterium]|nr:hypothetical protein [Actinomycetota bacterium]
MTSDDEVYRNPWWVKIGLSPAGDSPGDTPAARRETRARLEVLKAFPPPFFAQRADGGSAADRIGAEVPADGAQPARLSLEELRARMDEAGAEVRRELEAKETARRALGWTRIQAAYEASDADDVILTGVWEGFTRARATAWLWNLVQYEPYQFSPVFAHFRKAREAAVEAGEIPEVPTYAERARTLEAARMTPHNYRIAQEALGRGTFTPEEVRTGGCACES